MGNNKSSIVVLVLGLSNVGKTHFLDLLVYNENTTKQPTFGFYEVNYQNKIDFVEFGGGIPWTLNYHKSFNHVIMIVDANYSKNELREAKSAMLIALSKFSNEIPLTILIKGSRTKILETYVLKHLQLKEIQENRLVACQWINFDEKQSWTEGVSKLIEWIQTN